MGLTSLIIGFKSSKLKYDKDLCLIEIKEVGKIGCFLCKAGYYTNNNQECVCNRLRGCQECDDKKEKCIKCNSGYTYDKLSSTCICDMSNEMCKVCSVNKQVCNKCINGYEFIDYECLPSQSNGCLEYDQKICTKCKLGLITKKVGDISYCECKDKFNNCEECDDSLSFCKVCGPGYWPLVKWCKCSEEHGCKKCNMVDNDFVCSDLT